MANFNNNNYKRPQAHGIALKKQYGQHFLRDKTIVEHMLAAVTFDTNSSVFEIGCGDGFLTSAILTRPLKQLWIFEIDHDWASYVAKTYASPKLSMFEENILDVDFTRFEPDKPWTLLSNLPYQITFPILYLLKEHRDILKEFVIMIQEEVAQKLTKSSGRGYGFPTLFFQHYFELKLLDKIKPGAFFPPPKVDSRLVYGKPRQNIETIVDEEEFWKFIKLCFRQPRRTLKNNLSQAHYALDTLAPELLNLRAQQLSKQDFLKLWEQLTKSINI